MSFKKIITNLVLFLTSIVFTLIAVFVIGEIIFYKKVRLQPPLLQFHPITQTSIRPNLNTRDVAPGEFDVRYRTNDKGQRTPPYNQTKEANVIRILSTGDSFTFGTGVDVGERYTDYLSTGLQKIHSKQFEVINTGQPGWGQTNILKYLKSEGFQLKPDILLVSYFPNDPNDDLRAQLFELKENDTLVENKVVNNLGRIKQIINKVPLYDFLASHSYFLGWLRVYITVILNSQTDKEISKKQKPNKLGKDQTLQLVKLTLATMSQINQEALKRNIPSLFIIIPTRWKSEHSREDALSLIEPVMENCRRENMNCLNTAALLYDSREIAEELYYQINDNHWRPKSHKIVSEELVKKISDIVEKNNLIKN